MNTTLSILKKACVCALMMAPLSLCAQINVNYDALPDFDYVPPVKQELGIPGGNARNSKNGLKSPAYKSASANALPDHWNNALTKHFPPFFYQSGPSCMCSSFTGYIFTHELNSLRDLEGEKEENQMAIFFGWLQTYMNSSKEDIERDNGCPNAVDYEGRTNSNTLGYYTWRDNNSGWMQGYDKWHRAMFNRAEGFYTFPQSVAKEEGRLAAKRWLYNHNGDEDFKSGGLAYVTLAATGMSYVRIQETAANREAGVVGKYYMQKWGTSIDHAMTIIGWDDRIEFDFNGNGIFGEESADEKGAWIVANSWGASWCNGGWVYVPYRYAGPIGSVTGNYFWQPYVTYARKNVFPTRTIKLLMDYSHRNELRLSVGINPDTSATKPLYSTDMTSFKNAGNGSEEGGYPEVPMLGKWADGYHYEPMEFGYDLTDLSNSYDPSQPLKYFFTVRVSNNAGTGHIYKASIMDYRYETEDGNEIPFNIDTILIGRDAENSLTTISVVVPGEAINPPTNTTISQNHLQWSEPANTSLKLSKYYIYKDNTLIDSVDAYTKSYTTPETEGTYCVSAVYGYKTKLIESAKGNLTRNSFTSPTGDNVSLTLNEASMVVPNALPEKINQGTIEFWIKPTNIGTNSYRICGSSKEKFFFEVTPSGQATAGWDDDNKVSSAAKAIKANTWQHIAIVVQNNTLSLYVNGMRKGTTTSINNSGIPKLQDLLVGSADKPFSADIDELRIWRTARTQAEIYSGKDNAVAMPSAQSDLISYLPMNLIEVDGDSRVQEFVFNNHAYITQGTMKSTTNTSILKGSSFSMSPSITMGDSVYTNQPCLFKGAGSTNVVAWQWATPGATQESHSIQSPYVTYAQEGTYTISLTTTDAKGKVQTVEKEITVVKDQLPVVDFDMSAERQAVAVPLSFVNRTKGVNCTYRWAVEGQEDIRLTNANIIFNTPGTYAVTLYATNSAGTASATKTVEIYEAKPTSKFNIAPNNIYFGDKTYLEDKSLGSPSEWLWTINNGKRYIQVNGQFSSFTPPAPGFYDVSLQTANEAGVSTVSKTRALCVSNADAKNGLVFAGNDEQLQLNRPFAVNQDAFTIEWWMNPSTYSGAGSFTFGAASAICSEKGQYTITYNGSTINCQMPITNQWHHYALVFNRGNLAIYRDTERLLNYTTSRAYTPISWPETFTFGRSDNPFNGYVDEMRIWNYALSQEQLQQVCNQPIADPANTQGLCVYYDFNQNGGNVIDRTGKGNDAQRVHFGPDGDAWIITPGVFTLDFNSDIEETDVTDKYLTNYKAPFISNDRYVAPEERKGAKELLTETENSTWIFDSPRVNDNNTISTVYVDSVNHYYLGASTYYEMGSIYNQRLYQTISLPQGHYRFSLEKGNVFTPRNSRLLVCMGDTLVNNETISDALVSCSLTDRQVIEFDVANDNTPVSLGLLINLSDNVYSQMFVKSFKLVKITSTTQIADGINDAYDALNKGAIGTFTGERGAIRIVSNETIGVKIYNELGQCVFNEYTSGNQRIPLAPGLYIANGTKVLVK